MLLLSEHLHAITRNKKVRKVIAVMRKKSEEKKPSYLNHDRFLLEVLY